MTSYVCVFWNQKTGIVSVGDVGFTDKGDAEEFVDGYLAVNPDSHGMICQVFTMVPALQLLERSAILPEERN